MGFRGVGAMPHNRAGGGGRGIISDGEGEGSA